MAEGTDPPDLPQRLPRRERMIVLAAVAGVAAVSWLYLLRMPQGMTQGVPDMGGMAAMAVAPAWTAGGFALTLAMWVVMMAAMMLPSAAPMILTFAALHRREAAALDRALPTLLFAAGYLAVWAGFSVAATLLQWGLDRAALPSPMPAADAGAVGGILFVAAGLYQLTPLKQACLRNCRSPFAFLLNRWRGGRGGAFAMGVDHGAWCLGCCWLLMLLLFAVGVMNLLWVAALTLLVLAEKLLPGGAWLARLGGAAMIAWGGWLLLQG